MMTMMRLIKSHFSINSVIEAVFCGTIKFISKLVLPSRIFLKNGRTPASFSFIFGLFKHTAIQFLQQINVKKCQFHTVYGAGI